MVPTHLQAPEPTPANLRQLLKWMETALKMLEQVREGGGTTVFDRGKVFVYIQQQQACMSCISFES
jgi:hypothetical protein